MKIKYLLLAGVVALCGCRTAHQWRENADSRAKKWLDNAQKKELGHTEKIVVESAEDTLRRRLMLDQRLATSSPAALSIRELPDNGKWKTNEQLNPGEKYDAERWKTEGTLKLNMAEAIMVAAANSREFQNQKDALFRAALALDLEDHQFATTFNGLLKSIYSDTYNGDNGRDRGTTNRLTTGAAYTFKNGVELAASISVDLVKMLAGGHKSSRGITADASIMVPLLRGSGEFVVAEGLTQAQRNLVYQVRDFEQYKRNFVVSVATSYLGVLQAKQRIFNQEENYKRVITSTRRSRRMADAGNMPENQFDQAVQNELSARDGWISSRLSFESTLDSFKMQIGLPPDADIIADDADLEALLANGETLGGNGDVADYSNGNVPPADAPVELVEPDNKDAGPNEIEIDKAIDIALKRRPDLKNSCDKVWDAQRAVLIAQDSLRAEVTLGGSLSAGEGRSSLGQAGMPDGSFRLNRAAFSAPLTIDFGFERTRERNNYRMSLISLEQAVRSFQEKEDNIKQSVRENLRNLAQNRFSVVIQRQSVLLAKRRVDSTNLLLQAGRAEMRDVLEAQSALLSAQNSQLAALVSYRLSELKLQRDLGVLQVSVDGTWEEVDLNK